MKCFMLIIFALTIMSMSSAEDAVVTYVIKHDGAVQEVTESSNTVNNNPSHNPAPFGFKPKFQQPQHWYGNSHGQQFSGRTH